MALRQPKVRRRDFEEVGLGLTVDQAMAEARRCLQCSACCECRSCETVCSDVGAIDHLRTSTSFEFLSPGIIVADDQEMPAVNFNELPGYFQSRGIQGGLDEVDEYGKRLRRSGHRLGFAPSLQSGTRTDALGQTSRRGPVGSVSLHVQRNHGACDGFGSSPGEWPQKGPEVAHAEMVFSACHPRRLRPDRGCGEGAPAEPRDPGFLRMLPPGVPVHLLQ